MSLVKEGKLSALAVTTLKRSQALADVPTVVESGLPELEADVPRGIFVPAGTPKQIIDSSVYRRLTSFGHSPR